MIWRAKPLVFVLPSAWRNDEGDNPENSRVAFCPNKQRSFEPFMRLDQCVTQSVLCCRLQNVSDPGDSSETAINAYAAVFCWNENKRVEFYSPMRGWTKGKQSKNDLILPHCMAKYRRTKLHWHRGGVRKGVGGLGGRNGRWGVGGQGDWLGGEGWVEGRGLEELVQNQHLLDVVTAFIGPEYPLWAYAPQCALNRRGTPFLIHTPHVKMHKVCQGLCRLIHLTQEALLTQDLCCTDSMLYKKNTR